jgi:hypothetical protein
MPADEDLHKIGYYDRRVRKVIKRHRLGYNGFARLLLKGNVLTVDYRDLEDKSVLEESWSVDTTNGQLEWKVLHSIPELAVR